MRNWGLIRSGATFQALVSSVAFFEDPQAALFGRPGRDGAQDVRSGDGKRVYQAKFHQDQSASKAIADAKREAAKIATYRQADTALYRLWQKVTHWRLVTNAEFNPADRQRWDSEVVPVYADLGLVADYWERAHLDALLDKHRDLDRAYFGNETRAFLSLQEVRERLLEEEPLLRRTQDIGFFGRDSDVQVIRQFLNGPQLFHVVHGPGGIGKTRLLLETGRRIAEEGRWQVLWANVVTMGASAAWFDGVVPERETLLIVDEPPDVNLLRLLAEQIGGRVGRTTGWRIVVSVRSPKDPVLRFLRSPKVAARVSEHALSVLSVDAATAMCADLLGTGPLGVHSEEWRQQAAREVARRFNQHPVWVTLAVRVLETEGDLAGLPNTAAALADLYLEEVVSPERDQQSNAQILALLRWVALLGVVNRQDESVLQVLSAEAGFSETTGVQAALATLVRRRALVERGAENRLVELRPDVVRDHVLLRWLTVDVGFGSMPIKPSSDAITLAEKVTARLLSGTFTPTDSAMLVSLARTERILTLSGTPIRLLDAIFAALAGSLPTVTAGVGSVLAEALVPIAAHRPADTIHLIGDLRRAELPMTIESGIFGVRAKSRNDVIAELAWLAFHAAIGAVTQTDRTLVLDELSALARLEAEISAQSPADIRNDGKRAAALLERVICGGPEFLEAYDDAAAVSGLRLLETFATDRPVPSDRTLAKALIGAAISLERMQSWSENYTFHFRTVVLRRGSAAWATRETLVGRMRELVENSSSPLETRVLIWELLAEAHGSGIRGSRATPQAGAEEVRPLLLEDLRWTLSTFQKRVIGFEELAAARQMWEWHLRFDDDPESKDVSEALEVFYTANEIAAEMEPLLGDDDWERKSLAVSQKANALARCDAQELIGFLDRASRYLGGDHELYKLFDLGHHLGTYANTSTGVRSLIEQLLSLQSVTPRTDLAAIAASAWVTGERAERPPDEVLRRVEQMRDWCGSEAQCVNMISRVYGRSTRNSGRVSAAERTLVRSLAPKFLAEGQVVSYVHAIARVCERDLLEFTTAIDEVVAAVSGAQISPVITAVVEAVDMMTRDWRPDDAKAATIWLMEQVLRLPDLDPPGSSLIWHLEEILKRLGRLPIAWLPSAIQKRIDLERQASGGRVFAVGYKTHIGRYVQPVGESEAADPEVRSSVERLVALAFESGSIAHHLPRILLDVDPDGRLVPSIVASRVATVAPSGLWSLARLARSYKVNTPAWREIARPVLLVAARSPADERSSLFHALTSKDSQAWRSAVGEVPQVFRDAVQEARASLDGESDPSFVPLWRWTLSRAEARLRAEEEQAKEQRGE